MPGVFLSHSWQDKPFVTKLAVDLASRGFPVWFDSWELEAGDSLSKKIYQGIDQSGFLIVVLSESSITSRWVDKELSGALIKEEREGRKFILPLKIDGVLPPLNIADRIFADFSKSYSEGLERLAAVLEREGAKDADVTFQRQVIPISFSKGLYVDDTLLEARLQQLLSRRTESDIVKLDQIVVTTDASYEELRRRLRRRLDNIVDDAFYSPEFERTFRQYYQRVTRLERTLLEGIQLTVQHMAFERRNPDSAATAIQWFARLVRSQLLHALWNCQKPGEDSLTYGSDCDSSPMGSNVSAAKFYGLAEVVSCQIFKPSENGHITVQLDRNSGTGAECLEFVGFPQPLTIMPSWDFAKYVVPQMLNAALPLPATRPITWDLQGWRIGVS